MGSVIGLILYLCTLCILCWKLGRIGYSGSLWFIALLFGGPPAYMLATSLPDRNIELLRSKEEALLDQQLRQASLPVTEGTSAVPRATISDALTRFGEV